MKKFDEEDRFRDAGSAAMAVLKYFESHAHVITEPWRFKRGEVTDIGLTRAWAEFVRDAWSGGLLPDYLVISAVHTELGEWVIQHAITRAKR